MEKLNGIIIDGEFHELIDDMKDCNKCSLTECCYVEDPLCEQLYGKCRITFINRGKVNVQPISFDQILESNKDVLTRIKEQGD